MHTDLAELDSHPTQRLCLVQRPRPLRRSSFGWILSDPQFLPFAIVEPHATRYILESISTCQLGG